MRHSFIFLVVLLDCVVASSVFGQETVSLGSQLPSCAAQYTENDSSRVFTLDRCLFLASEENVNVRNMMLDFNSAKMLKREAFAHYFPVANFIAAGYHAIDPLVKVGVNDFLGSSDLENTLKYYIETVSNLSGINPVYKTLGSAYLAALTVTQPVYAGGRIYNSNRLAQLGVEAASLNESVARRDASVDVERKYWFAVSLEQKMKVVSAGLSLVESLCKDASSAYASGLLTDSDKDRAEIGRQELNVKRIRLKGGIMLSRMDLCNAIGLDCSDALSMVLADSVVVCPPPDSCYVEPSCVVPSLEESRLLDLAVRQKQLEKKIAMGEALPELAVGALYGYGRLAGSPQTNGMVFATLKIPITDWGIADSKMRNIESQLKKATNQKEYLGSMLELQLHQLWVEVESTWEELQLKEENLALSQNIFDKTSREFSAGMATMSSLLEKQLSLSNSECEMIDARIAYRNAVSAFQARCHRLTQ